MSNSHEPSYYEIALTNRQVIVAFVLLLLCLVAAFFSGVWIGRESGVRTATEQMVRNVPPPEEEKKEGQNLEEFEFFDSAQKGKPDTGKPEAGKPDTGKADGKAKAAEPAPEPETPSQAGTDTTLAEDFGAEDTEAGAAPRPSATSPATPPKKAPTPVHTPAVAAKPTPTPRPPKRDPEKTAEPARTAGQVVIQVFSSPEKEQAERIRDRLVGGGHKAYLSPVEVSGRTMYRVRIGPFASRDKAQQAAEQVRKGFKLDTWVTE